MKKITEIFRNRGIKVETIIQSITAALFIGAILRLAQILADAIRENISFFKNHPYIDFYTIVIFFVAGFFLWLYINTNEEKLLANRKEISRLEEILGKTINYLSAQYHEEQGEKIYDSNEMYRKLQEHVKPAKTVFLLDNISSDLDNVPRTEERKKWFELIKSKLDDTENQFTYKRVMYYYDPTLNLGSGNKLENNKKVYSMLKGDTKSHVDELGKMTSSYNAKLELSFLAFNKPLLTFVIVDDKILILQMDGIDTDKQMPQDLIVIKAEKGGDDDLIQRYKKRFETLAELSDSYEAVTAS